MRLRTLLIIGMIIAFLFGLALLLGPAIIVKFFGLPGTPAEALLGQLIGAGLIGVGIVSWFARDLADSAALQGTVLGLFITAAIAFIVSLLAVLGKTVVRGGNAWVAVILFLVFAVGFAYFQFFGPRE